MHAAHPLGVAAGEVVVHRDDVDAAAGERVEVRGQRRDQRLAFAGAHLGDAALVEDHAADELHVVVALADHPARGLADEGEGLEQQRRPAGGRSATSCFIRAVAAGKSSSLSARILRLELVDAGYLRAASS